MAAMFPLIEIQGAPFERGRLHGSLAQARVSRSLANYANLFEACGLSWAEAQRRAAPYRELIGNFDAELLEEMQGIARGAGRAESELLALNVRTEIMPAEYLESGDKGECTAIAVSRAASATGETLLAQNWDWLGEQRDSLVLLRIADRNAPSCLTLTEAGMLAKIGLNAAGFGVGLNILRSTDDGRHTGVPVHVLLRALLKRTSVADAVAFASKLRFGGSSNIPCADKGGDIASLEVAPQGLRVVRGENGTLCHTNHFLDAEAAAWQVPLKPALSTIPRLDCARRHAGSRARHGIEDLKRLLRDESDGFLSICRSPDPSLLAHERVESVASVIMELSRGVMHVAPDVPTRTEYVPVALEEKGVRTNFENSAVLSALN
jgi:isopenicillin-N N-acyltransferase-like protein